MNFYCKKLTQVDVGYELFECGMWLHMLAVEYYYIFSCLYGRWKCNGSFLPKTKLMILFY